jgi:hypothetical protein
MAVTDFSFSPFLNWSDKRRWHTDASGLVDECAAFEWSYDRMSRLN